MMIELSTLKALIDEHRLDASHRYLRDSIGVLARRERALDALEAHAREVALWAQPKVEQQRAHLTAQREQVEAQLAADFEALHGIFRDLHLDPPKDPADAASSWPLVSDAAARAERDDRLLRDTAFDGEMAVLGAVSAPPESPVIGAARIARELTQRIPQHQAHIANINERINETTIASYDMWAVETELDLERRGLYSDPRDPNARPELDPGLIRELADVGIDLGESVQQ